LSFAESSVLDFVTQEESTLAVEENHQLSSALHCVQQELSDPVTISS
jgi:hypothetical protein